MKAFEKIQSHLRSSWRHLLTSLRRLARRVQDKLDPRVQSPWLK